MYCKLYNRFRKNNQTHNAAIFQIANNRIVLSVMFR